jgi:hypothetical protein
MSEAIAKTATSQVPRSKRILAALVFLACVYGIFMLSKDPPITVFADGVHVVDIKDPGNYVAFYKGDLKDAFGWDVKMGRFRKSLRTYLEPLDEKKHVTWVFPFRDLSGVNFYSVAEFKVTTPGRYLLAAYWEADTLRCNGELTLEKNPVEKFVYQWTCGIVGAVAFLIMIGVRLPKGGY